MDDGPGACVARLWRAASRFVSTSGWWHECRHGTLSRKPPAICRKSETDSLTVAARKRYGGCCGSAMGGLRARLRIAMLPRLGSASKRRRIREILRFRAATVRESVPGIPASQTTARTWISDPCDGSPRVVPAKACATKRLSRPRQMVVAASCPITISRNAFAAWLSTRRAG
jgi:hypothetical protein